MLGFGFKGPRGDAGAAGAAGEQGEQGEQGDAGAQGDPGDLEYVDSGDPSGYDIALGSLTTDGTWNELDLSAAVPAGATVIHIMLNVQAQTAGAYFLVRKAGNSNARNLDGFTCPGAGSSYYTSVIVACDGDRKIEYMASNVTWDMISGVVRGWLI